MTHAQTIASRFEDDGHRWTDSDGHDLLDVLVGVARCYSDREIMPQRWQLPDGSAIVVTDGGWDLGITAAPGDCTCWSDDGQACREPDNCPCGCHDE